MAERGDDYPTYRAQCHCGAVCYEVLGAPVDAKICHCRTCQTLHGAPMQWAVIFHKHHVRFVRGEDKLTFYNSALKERVHSPPCKVACGDCGTLIADEGRRMWLAFPALFNFETQAAVPAAFKPTCHIFYAMRSLDVDDGLAKWAGHKGRSARLDFPIKNAPPEEGEAFG